MTTYREFQKFVGKLSVTTGLLLALTGCGGGSTPMTSVPVTVIDDAIGNAKVCLDVNKNGVCDAGEPFGVTDASGKTSLSIPTADIGKYAVLAEITTSSVDAKYGAVKIPFTLQAPADQTAVVSPLTTVVQSLVASNGISSAVAEASVRAQTGINVSLFEDFTKGTAPGSADASNLARMVVVMTQQQSNALAAAVGTMATDGSTIKQSDLNKAIQQKLLEILPALLTALSDPAVLGATADVREAALLTKALAIVASPETGITTTSIATAVAVTNQITTTTATAPTTETPSAGGNLTSLAFSDSTNWFSSVSVASAAQNTLNAAGNLRYVQQRRNTVAGNLATYTAGSKPMRQADVHYNGTAWVTCAFNAENTSTVRDASGKSSYNSCDNAQTGSSKRATFDVGGKVMASVFADIRAAGYTNLSIGDNTSAAVAALLGKVTFPTGSELRYQASTPLAQAISYYPGTDSLVKQFSAAVSAGGTGTGSTTATGTGCDSAEFRGNGSKSTTLELLIAANSGTPCVYPQGSFVYPFTGTGITYTSPDSSQEAWGNSTVSIGTLGTAPVGSGAVAPGFYSGNTKLRVAFKGTGANPVTYYACKERFNNGATRNCSVIGTGSYTITTLADGRALTLNGAPVQVAALEYTRVFVERGGVIYFGYQNRLTVNNTAGLNLKATNALFSQLGISTVDPTATFALTAGSYQGVWDIVIPALSPGPTLTLATNGAATCASGGTSPAAFTCTVQVTNPATGAFTETAGTGGLTGTFDFLAGTGSGSYNDPSITPATGTFTAKRR